MTPYMYLFIFCYSLSFFHICLLKIRPCLNNVNHDTEKGKQWIKLGAGRDSKTAEWEFKKTKCESGERQETKSTYFQQRSQKLLLFSTHHFTGASYIKQRGVACICDCGFVCVCVCAERQNLFYCCFSLSFVCFLHVGTSTVKSVKDKRVLKRRKLENTSTGNWF